MCALIVGVPFVGVMHEVRVCVTVVVALEMNSTFLCPCVCLCGGGMPCEGGASQMHVNAGRSLSTHIEHGIQAYHSSHTWMCCPGFAAVSAAQRVCHAHI